MGDAENVLHPSKKRSAGREISRDNPGLDDDEGNSDQETGTFKRASDQVLASRRIVKVRRSQTSSAPSSNPFAGLKLARPSDSTSSTSVVTGEAASCKIEVQIDASKEIDVEINANGKKLQTEADESKDEATADEIKHDVEKKADDKQSESRADESKDEATADEIKHDVEKKADDKQSESQADESKGEAIADMAKHDGGEKLFQPYPADVKDAEISKSGNESEKDAEVCKAGNESEKDLEPEIVENKDETNTVLQTTENENTENDGNQKVEKSADSASLGSFQLLSSSQNAFTGLVGTGFSASSFSFGATTKDGPFVCSSGFGFKTALSPFGFGHSNNGSSPIFGTPGESTTAKGEVSGFPASQEVSLATGEENEKPVFVADSVLFEYIDGGWKERGKGELKVNVSTTEAGKARLIMRTRGNYRLVLNASIFPDIKLTNMEKKGITFACVNSSSEGTGGLSTFALKFKDVTLVDEFRSCVMEHKGRVAAPAAALKTPENSPKTSNE